MAATKTEREKQIDGEIVDLARVATLAETSGKTADAVKAIERIGRLRVEHGRLRAIRIAEGKDDPVDRLRALSRIAASEGSWGPAGELAREGATLEADRDRAAAERAQAELDDTSLEDLASMLIDALDDLPDETVESLATACARRLGPQLVDEDEDE